MNNAWEVLYDNLLNEIEQDRYDNLSPELSDFEKVWDNVRVLVNNAMGSSPEDFEKVLRQAEKMMEPYDPNKTFYRNELFSRRWENGATRFRKENPDRYDVIVN